MGDISGGGPSLEQRAAALAVMTEPGYWMAHPESARALAAAPLPPPAEPATLPGPVADAVAVLRSLGRRTEYVVGEDRHGVTGPDAADALVAHARATAERDARLARMLTGVADWWRDNPDSPQSALQHLERACRAAAAELDGGATGGEVG